MTELVETILRTIIIFNERFLFKGSPRQNTPNSPRAGSPDLQWSREEINGSNQKPTGQVQNYAKDAEMILELYLRQESSTFELGNGLISLSHGMELSENGDTYLVKKKIIQEKSLRRRHKNLAFYSESSSTRDPIIESCLAINRINSSIGNVLDGILKEGILQKQEARAQNLVQKLQRLDVNDTEAIGLECIRLYTSNSFLSRSLNEFLGQRDYNKLDTLGPYCKLLYSQFEKSRCNVGSLKVYRGDYLSEQDLRAYQRGIGKKSYQWRIFTSTSKNSDLAKIYIDNAYFIIRLEKMYNDGRAIDIQKLSNFDEDEVLLRPGVEFSIESYECNESKTVHTFYLTAYI